MAAPRAVFQWIVVVYNRQRLNSAVGYAPPVAFQERPMPMPIAAQPYTDHQIGSTPVTYYPSP